MVDYSVLLGYRGAYAYTLWENDEADNPQMPIGEIVYAEDGKTYLFKASPTDNPDCYESTFIAEHTPWGSTLADTYEQLVFDRTVGWSRWIRLNIQHPNLYCTKDFNFELPWPKETNEGEEFIQK